ncbi:MAG: D-cysteine desulfhydrase family protein [Planctomycetota bacterium]
MTSAEYPPRLECATLPTPIERLARFSDAVGCGVDVWVKRDDLTGFALSGNKIRKLEFSFGRALAAGATGFVTCGGYDSNHCRATAFLAARFGLRSHLFLRTEDGAAPEQLSGNTLLDQLVGAEITWISRQQYAGRNELMAEYAQRAAAAGEVLAVIPEGASDEIGSFGYVHAAAELNEQLRQQDLSVSHVVHAVGSGGTTAGLSAGRAVHGGDWRILGVPVCDDGAYFRGRVEPIRHEMERFSVPELVGDGGIDFADGYGGRGYGLTTPEELRVLHALCRLEGLLLDPCYTGKAFVGLLREIQQGRFAAGSKVLFLHTGGGFSNYAFADEWRELLAEEIPADPRDALA